VITNTEQFQQDIEVLGMMYRGLAAERETVFPKSFWWYAIMVEGPIDQIRETQAEMHAYLELPLPEKALAASVVSADSFTIRETVELKIVLEQMSRMYRALGALRADVYPINSQVYELMAQPALAFIHAAQTAMDAYLNLAAAEAESANLARKSSLPSEEVSTR
jgi:hypothetical protein